MVKRHAYRTSLKWQAGSGEGTKSYKSYTREHVIGGGNRQPLVATSAFHSSTHYNPEELLIAALSSCHMLWYLHLCSENGITVVEYTDEAEGSAIDPAVGGKIERVILKPSVRITAGDRKKAEELHHEAHRLCTIANSVNFPVDCEPKIELSA